MSRCSVHLIGICGTAMATLAAMLKQQGSRRARLRSGRLSADERFPRARGHSGARAAIAPSTSPADLDLVVVGNAISRGNAELEEVLDRKIRYCSLPEAIREHFLWGARSIVIAGTHGKTTTTSLTGWLLTHGGVDPSVLVGGIAANFGEHGSSYRIGQRPRLRHRRRRIRQRVLRQDREVPQVPARHRRRQQHRVRSRGHLRGPRGGHARVPTPREPRAAARAARCSAPTAPELSLRGTAVVSRVETFGLATGADWQAHDLERDGRNRLVSAVRRRRYRSADSRCRCVGALQRRGTPWRPLPWRPEVGISAERIADGLQAIRRRQAASRSDRNGWTASRCIRRLRPSSNGGR